jgi:hypothetical protein
MPQKLHKIFRVILALAGITLFTCSLVAQVPELQEDQAEVRQKLTLIERAIAKDKLALLQYTWMEQDTISVKREVERQEHFQVRMGADGRHQKTSLDQPTAGTSSQGTPNEYKDYADQIRALMQQYLPSNQELLEQTYQNGFIKAGPEGGTATGQYQLVVFNYLKKGDTVTLIFDKVRKKLVSLTVNSYLNDPSDVVSMNAHCSKIPGGPNHFSTVTIQGVRKQLTIAVQNSNYREQGMLAGDSR